MEVRNLRISQKDYEYYRNRRFAMGGEGTIAYFDSNKVIKLFHNNFGQKEEEQIEKIRERKFRKIAIYATMEDLKNPLRITDFVTYQDKFVGYVQTLAPGYSLKGLSSDLDIEEKLYILRQTKDILLDFHNNNIIYGDVRSDNIVYDPDSKIVTFVDVDNAQIEGIEPELKNGSLGYFYEQHGSFDEVVDSIEHNILTIQMLNNLGDDPMLYQYIADGKLKEYTKTLATKRIIKDTKQPTKKTKERYLIDHIDDSGKVYRKGLLKK